MARPTFAVIHPVCLALSFALACGPGDPSLESPVPGLLHVPPDATSDRLAEGDSYPSAHEEPEAAVEAVEPDVPDVPEFDGGAEPAPANADSPEYGDQASARPASVARTWQCVEYQCDGCDGGNGCKKRCASGSTCTRYAPRFELPGPDAEIYSACTAAVQRSEACEAPVGVDCDRRSRVDSPELAEVYRCIADSPCGAPLASCWNDEESSWGSEVCAHLTAACDRECSPDWIALANRRSAELRWDAWASVSHCWSAATCGEIELCLAEWFELVDAGETWD